MSFSKTVKDEISKLKFPDKCCILAEMSAVALTSASIETVAEKGIIIRLNTENAAVARRVYSGLKSILGKSPEVSVNKNRRLKRHAVYKITAILNNETARKVIGRRVPLKACCSKSFLRGAFLAGGSVSDPGKVYHLEIKSHNFKLLMELLPILERYGLNAGITSRKGKHVLYFKGSGNIVDFLNIIGAHGSLLDMENVRVMKEIRNTVNRRVNCETANLDKTVNAAVRQLENINLVSALLGFERLPPDLREAAELRLKYPDAGLRELGAMCIPALGKSGVNHRLRKLDGIAQELRTTPHADNVERNI